MAKPKNILLGVTGSISAYKSAPLVRLFVKEGFHVKVILTPSAKAFVTPLTLATVSNNPVETDMFNDKSGQWVNHVELGAWADLMLIAPLSANTLAKMANGICDNLLLSTYLSAKCPVMVAPAMDHDMWHHKSTQRNITQLGLDNVSVIQPAHGQLASGIIGDGRLPEPEFIFKLALNHL